MAKLLFFDIDGTLVHRGCLPEQTVQAIHEARKNGCLVFLSTGRHLGALKHAERIERDGVIFCNGAGILVGERILETHPIPAEILRKTLAAGDALQGCCTLLCQSQSFKNDAELADMRERLKTDERFDTFEEMITAFGAYPLQEYDGQAVLKTDIGFANEQIADEFAKTLDPSLCFVRTAGFHRERGKRSGEITAAGIDKGTAVRRVISYLKADPEETWAFGDSMNDYEMFQAVRHACAVGNALAEIKAEAEYITGPADQAGIADALRHYGVII